VARQSAKEQAMRDWEAFNRGVVEHLRANGGVGPGRWADRPLLVLTTTGARSGQPRTTPLIYTTDGDRLVVIASKGGEPTNPDWYHNLLAHPEATVEVGGERFPVRATFAEGAERRRLFDQQAAQMPFFAEYERTTPREIPVVVLTRLDVSGHPGGAQR
jgi:deazaflavin-dependent oxidoreductase (nitroreductase family)